MEWLIIFAIGAWIFKWLFVDSSKGFHLARMRKLMEAQEKRERVREKERK